MIRLGVIRGGESGIGGLGSGIETYGFARDAGNARVKYTSIEA